LYAGKPIIGLAGGIGSGKSHVAALLREMGCRVIDSDAQVRAAYETEPVRRQLRNWWGEEAFTPDGRVDRRAIGRRVFSDAGDRERVERLIHPLVAADRGREMAEAAADKMVLAFVWDTPLLFEKGLNRECDAVVFIESPWHVRLQRVADSRGWSDDELRRRENFQWPLDKKRSFSDYVLQSTADAEEFRSQVRQTLSRILANQHLSGTFDSGRT
jgi:dephospho-CoA kinase